MGFVTRRWPAPLAIVAALLATSLPSLAHAQSLNIHFGTAPPPPTYAGAGPAGTWNAVGVLGSDVRQPLVGLTGQATGAKIYMTGGTALYAHDDPTIGGSDAALMDEMLIGYNDPTDVCIWVEDLEAGDYDVLMYALTPSNPTLHHRVRVDDGDPGPTEIGGAWPGEQQAGVTYQRFRVTTSGTIGLHSGLPGGYIESGLNGFQLVRSGPGDLPTAAPTSLPTATAPPTATASATATSPAPQWLMYLPLLERDDQPGR